MLNIAYSHSLVDKFILISDLYDLLVLDDYGCSFVAKLNWYFFFVFYFEKIFVFFTKYTLFAEKKVCFFFWCKKTFFTEKNINKNVKNIISFHKYIFTQKMFVLQKSFLSIYIDFARKIFLIIENIFLKTSLWTQ